MLNATPRGIESKNKTKYAERMILNTKEQINICKEELNRIEKVELINQLILRKEIFLSKLNKIDKNKQPELVNYLKYAIKIINDCIELNRNYLNGLVKEDIYNQRITWMSNMSEGLINEVCSRDKELIYNRL